MIVDVNGAPEFAFRHFPHFLTKHGRVKLNRPIKVGDRDICQQSVSALIVLL
jgi:hypothetical protein